MKEKIKKLLTFKKEKRPKKQVEKKKNKPTLVFTKRRYRQVIVYGGWAILICSLSFAVYKNFTAIDRETVMKETRIEEKVKDTSGVESFVRNFAQEYFSLNTDSDFKNNRGNQLSKYMSDFLISTSDDMLKDVSKKVEVTSVQIWNVKIESANNFDVTFTVNQKFGDKRVSSAYVVKVYQEGVNYTVTRLPYISTIPSKADHEVNYLKASEDVTAEEREKVEEFLQTFFKIYPKADANELAFYVKGEKIRPIFKNYQFVSIDNLVINVKGNVYEVEFIVKYQDRETKVIYSNQYLLNLEIKESGELVISEVL